MKKDIRKKPSLITIFLLSYLLLLNSVVFAEDNSQICSLDNQKYTNFELNVVDFKNENNNVNPDSTVYEAYPILKTDNDDIIFKATDLEIDKESSSVEFRDVIIIGIKVFLIIGAIMIIITLTYNHVDLRKTKKK